uniref:von Willebrand factor A domain-containing protein 5A n=1 Tax=Peromyscus maniculatus bairdii TaxID=230844 RepID=A0A8C8W2L7_PERMB
DWRKGGPRLWTINPPLPLKSISVTLSINDFVAGVSTTLNYENEEKVPLEAIFVFPMDEDSAVYSFEALVDGKKIVAELQEKMEAHRNYEDALSQGHQAYLLEEDDYSRDVFSCNVGNLHPGSKVAVTLRYVQELPLETDGALRYVLPAILNPRYKLSGKSANSCLNIKTPITPLEELPYTLSLVATITSQHAIERIQSNCSLNIPEVEASRSCGEFVFLMDCSGSMKSPMNNQKDSQLRIEAAKETLLLLLKSLPMGCYFNIYRFGSSYEKFFPESMKYTQKTMEEAVERVKDLEADLGGTEILTPLLDIYKAPCIPGHPLQLFVFTDGEVSDTFSVIKEVQLNSKKHRCFSFGIGEGASTSLIKGIARVSGGSAEFITSKDRMQTKALGSLKFALSCSADDIALSWDLPPGLLAYMLSPEQTVIFRGQRLIVYAQLTGTMPQVESSGEVCLKYTLQGRSLENRVTFSLQPKTNASFTIHRLAAKSLIQTKDLGSYETSQRTKEDVVSISIQSGVLSSFTAYIAINKELNQPVQGPLAHRVIPRPVMSTSFCACKVKSCKFYPNSNLCIMNSSKKKTNLQNDHKVIPIVSHAISLSFFFFYKGFGENVALQLILLQKANGSWELDEDLTKILGTNLEDIKAANPAKDGDPSAWATVLAVLWLHANGKDTKYEWELLERKAVTWLHDHAGRSTAPPIPFPLPQISGALFWPASIHVGRTLYT